MIYLQINILPFFSIKFFRSLNPNRKSVPPWSESNGGINLINIGWMILWSIADLFGDIQISML